MHEVTARAILQRDVSLLGSLNWTLPPRPKAHDNKDRSMCRNQWGKRNHPSQRIDYWYPPCSRYSIGLLRLFGSAASRLVDPGRSQQPSTRRCDRDLDCAFPSTWPGHQAACSMRRLVAQHHGWKPVADQPQSVKSCYPVSSGFPTNVGDTIVASRVATLVIRQYCIRIEIACSRLTKQSGSWGGCAVLCVLLLCIHPAMCFSTLGVH